MMLPIGSDQLNLNLARNQQNLATLTSQLSSGLRIQTAADDPSGLAISENLRSRISGLQQSVENVQTGGNLLTVADGAAATIQQILQRIRSLIVESNSDINSNEQLSAIQTEIDQGLLEINRIAQNANFNGVKLFDGSHDTYVANPNANVTAVEINPGLLHDGSGAPPTSDSVSNPQAPPGGTGQLFQLSTAQANALASAAGDTAIQENANGKFVGPLLVIGEVTAFQANAVDPSNGFALGGPGVLLEQILYSTSTGFSNGNGNESNITNAVGTNNGFAPGQQILLPNGTQDVNLSLPNLSPGDVGVAIGFELFLPKQSGGGTALGINDGGQEGSTVSISLPTLNTNALQVSGISVLRPTVADMNPASPTFGQAIAADSSNQYAAMDAQIRVDAALDQISSLRAQVGAQIVATNEDASNDNTATVNLQATESSIRDLNVGTATTEFTREQILNSVGTSVLAQSEVSARQLTALLIGALVA